jgi:hypothetical protein
MKTAKRSIIVLLAATTIFAISACGGGGKDNAPTSEVAEVSGDSSVTAAEVASPGSDEVLPLEIVENGYAVKDGFDEFYIQYAFIVKNPNAKTAVEYPTVRITARDESGTVLGTEDIVGSFILPGGTWVSAFQGPSCASQPANVDFEVVPPDDYNLVSPELLDYPGAELTVENTAKTGDKITGEVSNSNDYEIASAGVTVLYRDDSGKLLAGDTTYTDKIAAGGKIPFELSIWDDSYVTDNFEVYAYPWM